MVLAPSLEHGDASAWSAILAGGVVAHWHVLHIEVWHIEKDSEPRLRLHWAVKPLRRRELGGVATRSCDTRRTTRVIRWVGARR
jgi:hypothetical protein